MSKGRMINGNGNTVFVCTGEDAVKELKEFGITDAVFEESPYMLEEARNEGIAVPVYGGKE